LRKLALFELFDQMVESFDHGGELFFQRKSANKKTPSKRAAFRCADSGIGLAQETDQMKSERGDRL
jgi:hypothetical protein